MVRSKITLVALLLPFVISIVTAAEEFTPPVATGANIFVPTPSNFNREQMSSKGLMSVNAKDVPRGFILYTPVYPADKNHNIVRMVDTVTGNTIHTWDLGSRRPGLWGYLPRYNETEMYKKERGANKDAEKGALFYISQTPLDQVKHKHDFIAWRQDHGGIMELINPDGSIVWTYEDENQHHDARLTRNGLLAYIAAEPMTNATSERSVKAFALARRMVDFPVIQGGLLGFLFGQTAYFTDYILRYFDGKQRFISQKMYADVMHIVNPITKQSIFEWRVEDYLSPSIDRLNFNDPLDEWTHANTIVPIYRNKADQSEVTHLMVSFRQISTIIIIDIKTKEFKRVLRYPFISQQHDCSLLENNGDEHILVFNNRYIPNDGAPVPFSQVIEFSLSEQGPHLLNPMVTGPKALWHFEESGFYSGYISGAQRFYQDGKKYTLITEGMNGRMMIVRHDDNFNNVVFEYKNPEVATDENMLDAVLGRSAVFRARFYPYSSELAQLWDNESKYTKRD